MLQKKKPYHLTFSLCKKLIQIPNGNTIVNNYRKHDK